MFLSDGQGINLWEKSQRLINGLASCAISLMKHEMSKREVTQETIYPMNWLLTLIQISCIYHFS
jgi:hypothetical protein